MTAVNAFTAPKVETPRDRREEKRAAISASFEEVKALPPEKRIKDAVKRLTLNLLAFSNYHMIHQSLDGNGVWKDAKNIRAFRAGLVQDLLKALETPGASIDGVLKKASQEADINVPQQRKRILKGWNRMPQSKDYMDWPVGRFDLNKIFVSSGMTAHLAKLAKRDDM